MAQVWGWAVRPSFHPEEFAQSSAPGTGTVTSVNAGTGISITGTATDPVVNNTGVLSFVTVNTGLTNIGSATAVQLQFNGTQSVTAGTGISLTGTFQNPVVNNTGVLTVTAGSRVSLTGTAANPVINSARPPQPFMTGSFRSGAQDTDTVTLAPATAESVTDAPGFPCDVATALFNFRVNFENYTNVGTAGNLTFDLLKNEAAFHANILSIAPGFTGQDDVGENAWAFAQGDSLSVTMKPGGSGPDDIRFTWAIYAYT